MPHWLIKSGIQRVISWLPASAWWNEVFQTHITRSLQLSQKTLEDKVGEAARFLDRFRTHQPLAPDSFTAFELGTGWYPTLPIAFYLCGAAQVHTFDIASYLSATRLAQVLDCFCAAADQGTLLLRLPSALPERINSLHELRDRARHEAPARVLSHINVHVNLRDGCDSGLEPGSVDFIFSCSVLEYVPRAVLPRLLAEFRRIASARSAMVHWLNVEDQFRWFDPAIGPYHCLRYSDRQWRWLDSPLVSKNRLRINDFREQIVRAGFHVKAQENHCGSADDLNRVPLAPEFRKYSTEDLLVIYSLMTAVPNATATK